MPTPPGSLVKRWRYPPMLCHCSSCNPGKMEWLSLIQGYYSAILHHDSQYDCMQKGLNAAVVKINGCICKISSLNGMYIPCLAGTVVRTRIADGKEPRFLYHKLFDGVHSSDDLTKVWATKISKAVNRNRLEPMANLPLSKTILLNTWHSCWRVSVCDDHGCAPWWGHCSLLLSLSFITSLTLPCILMMGVHLGGATKSYCHYHYNYCQYMCLCAIKGTYQQIHLCHKLIASKAFSYPLGSSVTVSSCWL